MQSKPKLTHMALRVNDIDRSAEFYRRYAGLDLISDRQENNMRVAWLGHPEINDSFIIVLLEMPHSSDIESSYHHLGLQVETREAVDAAAETARQEGILMEEPSDHGPVAGYLCIVRDPDGNGVEFSYGQEVFETLDRSAHETN